MQANAILCTFQNVGLFKFIYIGILCHMPLLGRVFRYYAMDVKHVLGVRFTYVEHFVLE